MMIGGSYVLSSMVYGTIAIVLLLLASVAIEAIYLRRFKR